MTVTLAMENGAKTTGLNVIPEFHVLAYGTEMIADTEDRVVQATRKRAVDYLAVIAKAAAPAGVECDTVATNRTLLSRELHLIPVRCAAHTAVGTTTMPATVNVDSGLSCMRGTHRPNTLTRSCIQV
ncbi:MULTISPECIES: hypothetical protein [unclassified Paraburkholderia]|uniref:hypothetical protein n=1 Tax=unclassified Paraburkholderia TaxID=2615204 RepID=UPI0017A16EAA|nr:MULTISPECIES: hypothetical protein [unclassified Paraburkholderia]MBB5445451.1 hypothetical protein [Paraburkholderia sp. WSM4177]MBB5486069.1 hypothetical protein [Paraburkholderia sp. WSM4180]